MSTNNEDVKLPQRHTPVHWPVKGLNKRSILQFVTVCTKERRPLLAQSLMHERLRDTWSDSTHYLVGRYVIMPDHVHLFCSPASTPPEDLGRWIRFRKSAVARANPAANGKLWQRDYWDTQLRSSQSYAAKWDYVQHNPVRAGLVNSVDDWPYQGEIHPLIWHD